jgi:hypothetical protein
MTIDEYLEHITEPTAKLLGAFAKSTDTEDKAIKRAVYNLAAEEFIDGLALLISKTQKKMKDNVKTLQELEAKRGNK